MVAMVVCLSSEIKSAYVLLPYIDQNRLVLSSLRRNEKTNGSPTMAAAVAAAAAAAAVAAAHIQTSCVLVNVAVKFLCFGLKMGRSIH